MVVDVERGRQPFSFPLRSSPQLEEAADPTPKLVVRILVAPNGKNLPVDFFGRSTVANGRSLDVGQHIVRHQVSFIGLFRLGRPQFGRGRLLGDDFQKRARRPTAVTVQLEPPQPPAQETLVDAADRAESAGRVAVHRGIADGRLRPVARAQQDGSVQIGEQPRHGGSSPRLNVLKRRIILVPSQASTDGGLSSIDVSLHQ